MKTKKSLVGAAVTLALFINFPQVSAEEVVTFGKDSDNVNEPFEEDTDYDFGPELIFNDPENNNSKKSHSSGKKPKKEKKTPTEKNHKDTKKNPPNEDNPEATGISPSAEKDVKPAENETPSEEKPKISEDPNLIEVKPLPPRNTADEDKTVLVIGTPKNSIRDRILPPSRITERTQQKEKSKHLKTQKQRFVKFAIDDNYIYYLDKQNVSWTLMPYSASEYMLDVWIRMIEKNPDTSELPGDLSDYINDKSNGEIELAAENGKKFTFSDTEVLQSKRYFLEHYYLRPSTKQIQFICSLEVVGHPQNTISERVYSYQNWENLIPDSVESKIYRAAINEFGKKGSPSKGKMSFADALEEYARISIR